VGAETRTKTCGRVHAWRDRFGTSPTGASGSLPGTRQAGRFAGGQQRL
jgi:hypothetical protein